MCLTLTLTLTLTQVNQHWLALRHVPDDKIDRIMCQDAVHYLPRSCVVRGLALRAYTCDYYTWGYFRNRCLCLCLQVKENWVPALTLTPFLQVKQHWLALEFVPENLRTRDTIWIGPRLP